MPRIGMGIPIAYTGSTNPHLAIDDFTFLNDVSGELTPNNTATRTNKILHSQDLKQSTWTKTNSAIASDLYEAPDNSTTANAIQNDATSDEERKVTATHAIVSGETYTLSGHFKKGLYNFVKLYHSDTAVAFSAFFNITTGAVSGASNTLSTSFDKIDDGWIRCSMTFQATATGNGGLILSAVPTSSLASAGIASGVDQDLIYVWGMQLEEDSRPSSYIVTTNAAVNVATTLNDLSEMFDFDGTDIMLETSLDKSEGAFDKFDDIVVNGNFAADSNWSKGSDVTIASGKLVFDEATSNTDQSLDTTNTTSYEITFTISDYSGSGSLKFQFAGTSAVNGTSRTANGVYTEIITTTSNNSRIRFVATDFSGKVNNVIVSEYAITPKSV